METLYKQYYTMVYRLCLLMLKNTQDAEDATQSVFLKVMEKQPVFTDEDHTRAWLLTVTRNYCRDVMRSFWHKKRTDMEQLPEQAAEPFDKQESLLFEIFQTLPAKYREVVYLYYFEDYSVKEIAALLDRKESTIQSQLSAARKRMKKQFSAIKGAALILCLILALGFVGITADTASGGKAQAAIREIGEKVQASFHRLLSDEAKQIADETVSLPVQVYASDLVGIDKHYLALANERGLLIYDRTQEALAAVLDLQQMECNYLNANSIATRIFMQDEKLYLFNETGIEQRAGKETSSSLPEFAYICDLSMLSSQSAETNSEVSTGGSRLNKNLTSDTNIDNIRYLTRTTDPEVIRGIYNLWMNDAKKQICDTFDSFYGSEFLNSDAEKYDGMYYSENSLYWTGSDSEKLLSCLVVYGNTDYELYTKHADGSLTSEKLKIVTTADEIDAPASSDAETAADPDTLPPFTYTGDDKVLATICAYMKASEEAQSYYGSGEDSVYIPAPLILDIKHKGDDLIVFCNLWSYSYYRNGNTLECESGGEAPARLRLHPDADAPGGYQIIEDLRTGDGSEYEKGIKAFCKGYPGMKRKYFSDNDSEQDEIRTALIRMYVQDNGLDIKYYKDYGWDPVPIN